MTDATWEVFDRPSRDKVRELASTGELRERAATQAEKKEYDNHVRDIERVEQRGVVRITHEGEA